MVLLNRWQRYRAASVIRDTINGNKKKIDTTW